MGVDFMEKYQVFLNALRTKSIVKIVFETEGKKRVIQRNCVPLDYGPSLDHKDKIERYRFYDLDSPAGAHDLYVLPKQIIEITLTGKFFNPGDYITDKPKWHTKRDWGSFS
jgi:hypothetical protein